MCTWNQIIDSQMLSVSILSFNDRQNKKTTKKKQLDIFLFDCEKPILMPIMSR
jgi:hypothetical protein